MSVDEQLLSRDKASSADKVAALNQARRGGVAADSSVDPTDLSALRHGAQAEQESAAARLKSVAVAAVAAPVSRATGNLLQQAWLNLIDSFGLTLIWINIHVFLGMVIGKKFFCSLGEEWVSSLPPALGGEGKAKKMTGLMEGMLLALLDVLALALIFFAFVLVAMLVDAITNPLGTIASLLKSVVWNALGLNK